MTNMRQVKKPAFGLDISDLSLKIVQLKRKRRKITLASFVKKDIPTGLIKDGEIENDQELVKLLKKALTEVKGDKLKSNRVICNLPEEKLFVRVIQLPKMKEEEIGQAVYWEAENHIPLKIEEVYLDWQMVKAKGKNINQLDILIAAAPRTLIDSYLGCLKKADLRPIALEPESVALVTSLIKEDELTKPVVIVDMGATGTNLVVFSTRAIPFTSRVPVSGNALNQAIVQNLKISQAKADQVKIKLGLVKEKKVYQALEPLIVNLAEQIQDCVNFYSEHAARVHGLDEAIAQVLLCGGDSLLIGLPEFLSERLNLPVKLGNPWINISPFIPKKAQKMGLSYKESLLYTTALGLALRDFR